MSDRLSPVTRSFGLLLEVNQALTTSGKLRPALERALEILQRADGAIRGSIIVADATTGQLRTEVAWGVAGGTMPMVHTVVESGRPMVVPHTSQEPLFGKPGKSGPDRSFFCVPILIGRKSLGAVEVELAPQKDREYDAVVERYRVVASMIAQALKVERLVDSERQRLRDENLHLREELKEKYDYSHIIGSGGPMRQVFEQISQVARANTTVLIRGESGTGKELIAHAIHYNSQRARKPFVKVSCGALPDTLIESELFGYEKGAFTGAEARKKGRFELAEGGTLFLDEIGDINLATQVKLLRVLQEREYERLGGTEPVKSNVRLIAATNQPLEDAIAAGTFRADLHYRLNVFTIFVPPLRERRTDITLIAEHFLEKYSSEHGKQIRRISTPAIDMLMSYHWPGNVRELENTIERAVLVCDGSVIHGHHLPPTLQTAESTGTVQNLPLAETVGAFEKDLIQDALKTTRGNRAKAAQLLQSTERIIRYKVKLYGIDVTRFRS
ncbi:MAG: sigma 54-interacting transcriptional regulator [Vicinamibacterales bacterium]|nr:sigma 54-interacting transcriptional regulator [Vicinamibacterales bacterium]